MVSLLILASALAQDEPFIWSVPEPRSPVSGECTEAVDLVVGQPVPAGLLDAEGRVACYATVVPTSQLASMMEAEAWARQAAPRGRKLTVDLDWEAQRYARLRNAYDQPTAWTQRPGVQRTMGRAETLGVLVLAIGIYAVLDSEVVR